MEKNRLRVLFIEDSEDDVTLCVRALRRAGYDPFYERVETPAAMDLAQVQKPWDVIISDYYMPHFSALTAFQLMRLSGHKLPFVLVSGTLGAELELVAARTGIRHYVSKNEINRLAPAVERALKEGG